MSYDAGTDNDTINYLFVDDALKRNKYIYENNLRSCMKNGNGKYFYGDSRLKIELEP